MCNCVKRNKTFMWAAQAAVKGDARSISSVRGRGCCFLVMVQMGFVPENVGEKPSSHGFSMVDNSCLFNDLSFLGYPCCGTHHSKPNSPKRQEILTLFGAAVACFEWGHWWEILVMMLSLLCIMENQPVQICPNGIGYYW